MIEHSKIVVVEDDPDLREAIEQTLGAVGFTVSSFASTQMVSVTDVKTADCLILDFWLPYETGLQFLRRVSRELISVPPVIFVSGHADVRMAVDAMKAGACELLQKPVRPTDLLETVNRALSRTGELRRERGRAGEVLARYRTLTAAERKVMSLVCSGLKSKQVAFALKRSENTVKIHRARVMQKMACNSVVELFEMHRIVASAQGEESEPDPLRTPSTAFERLEAF